QQGDRSTHVVRCAPATDRRQAFGDQVGVPVVGPAGHVSINDARSYLEDPNSLFGQASGEELGHHAQAALGDAVIATVGGNGVCAETANVDNGGPAQVRQAGDHRASHALGEEVGPLEVDGQHPVPAILVRFKDVLTAYRGNAGVVDQHVDTIPPGQH